MTTDQRSRLTALVAALRSRKYKQCFDTARDGRGAICAMIVARHAARDVGGRLAVYPARLIVDVINWNDRDRLTFPQIADRIEAQWLAPTPEQTAAIEQVIAETIPELAEAV